MTEEARTLGLGDLTPDPTQARRHTPRNIGLIADALQEVGAARSIVIDEDYIVRAGNGTVEAAAQVGIERVRIVEADGHELIAVLRRGLTPDQKRRLALFDNRAAELAEWDEQVIASIMAENPALLQNLFTDDELEEVVRRAAVEAEGPRGDARTLAERFIVPPFSVLDARQGYWQERKRAWLSLGIESEIGRGENLLKHNLALNGSGNGTSVFDPVLCELAYRWFCPASGVVLDPFAGGSVRGVVASRLGRAYLGIELRAEQIAANEAQAARICRPGDPRPLWIHGDAAGLDSFGETRQLQADFLFTCPPYFDLEVYSDDPRDLSNAPDDDTFLAAYERIIRAAVERLRPHRFACVVVGDVRERGKRGTYRLLPFHTVRAFEKAGAALYNEGILVTALGTLAQRVGIMFRSGRKLGPTHQYVLVFIKGDPREAVAALGEAEFGDAEQAFGEVL